MPYLPNTKGNKVSNNNGWHNNIEVDAQQVTEKVYYVISNNVILILELHIIKERT